MNMTQITQKNLALLLTTTGETLEHFYNKGQNELVRFVFCGLEKLFKVTKGINLLYPLPAKRLTRSFGVGFKF